MSADMCVDVRNVQLAFRQSHQAATPIFTNLTFAVRKGELVVVIGKSGGGKTTLLNLLVGILEPDRGEIDVMGNRPRDARHRMGFMLARDALLPWRSARRNVEYGMEIRGVSPAERRSRAERYLDKVELAHAADRWPWQLSQGMRQRVALARTWALQPELMLMDEPFAALDAQTRARVQQTFVELWASDKRSVIFVTHDLEEAVLLADRIVVIGDGQVLAEREVPFVRPRDYYDLIESHDYHKLLADLRHLIA